MKKILTLALISTLVLALLVGCGSTEQATTDSEGTEGSSEYKDGTYFAQEENFSEESGWKYLVTLKVKDGKIDTVDWNAVHQDGGDTKKTVSKSGEYKMVEIAGAQAPWYEQAEKVEAYLLEKQDPKAIEYKDDEGHTDAISGVSISVNPFFILAEKALANGPVESGKYQDGAYHAEEKEFNEETGYKYTVDITVVNGNIVVANWNGIHKDGGDTKKTLSKNGEYKMVEIAGAQAPWFEQAEKAETYLVEKQDPTAIEYKDDEGHTDAISGVSISVNPFFKLAQEALADAK